MKKSFFFKNTWNARWRDISINIHRLLPGTFVLLRSMGAAEDCYKLDQLSAHIIMFWFSKTPTYLSPDCPFITLYICSDQSLGYYHLQYTELWWDHQCMIYRVQCSQNNWGVIILNSYCSVQLYLLLCTAVPIALYSCPPWWWTSEARNK
jgi:hypothetical protein